MNRIVFISVRTVLLIPLLFSKLFYASGTEMQAGDLSVAPNL